MSEKVYTKDSLMKDFIGDDRFDDDDGAYLYFSDSDSGAPGNLTLVEGYRDCILDAVKEADSSETGSAIEDIGDVTIFVYFKEKRISVDIDHVRGEQATIRTTYRGDYWNPPESDADFDEFDTNIACEDDLRDDEVERIKEMTFEEFIKTCIPDTIRDELRDYTRDIIYEEEYEEDPDRDRD